MDESRYLETVREGDTRTRLNAVRQLKDELDGVTLSTLRCSRVFEIVEDEDGLEVAGEILALAARLDRLVSLQLHAHKTRLSVELRCEHSPDARVFDHAQDAEKCGACGAVLGHGLIPAV